MTFFHHRAAAIRDMRESRYFAWWIGRYSHEESLLRLLKTFNYDWFHPYHGAYHRRRKRMKGIKPNRFDRWDERLFGDTPYGRTVANFNRRTP